MRRALLALTLWGCTGGASANPGLGAIMRVEGAQFVPGDMPEGEDGPEVAQVFTQQSTIFPGMQGKRVTGAVGVAANAVAFQLRGDPGFWVVPADAPFVEVPDLPSFAVEVDFDRSLLAGEHELIVGAVDDEGRFGAQQVLVLQASVPAPAGDLVFTLQWDRHADLDLHVTDPTGVEVWAGNLSSWQRPLPGEPSDPDGWMTAGRLDFDSNSSCDVDGRNQENVFWPVDAPAGRYQVRVDAFSLCGETTARWQVQVLHEGMQAGGVHGVVTAHDTRFPHEKGAGLLVLEVDVP